MDAKPLQIVLIPAPDDLPEESDEYQAELHRFNDSLQEEGLNPSFDGLIIEAVGRDVAPLLGVFKLALPGTVTLLSAALGAWLKGKYGRTVELEIDGTKAKASTVAEVQALLRVAQNHRELNQPKRIVP